MTEITIDMKKAKETALESRIKKIDTFMDKYLYVLAENNRLKKLQVSDRERIQDLLGKIEELDVRLKKVKK
jgi:FtsZ-binding cell division protein ZapB